MHKLDRSSVTVPSCLAAYDYPTQTWDDFGRSPCKRQVRFALFQMQGMAGITSEEAGEYGLRCAYCEGEIRHEGHIEHFRRKNTAHRPDLTFDWNNLFLVCGARIHCGHYKDCKGAPAYDADHLIKPDEHDPEQFLYFHSSGEVRPRSGLSADDAHRARETISVFGLNNPALKGQRAKAAAEYRKEVDEVLSWPEAERLDYIRGEIAETRWRPYATTINHFFLRAG